MWCAICGKYLRDFINTPYGLVCSDLCDERAENRWFEEKRLERICRMMASAQYTMVESKSNKKVLVIKDIGNHRVQKTITNDAEQVVRRIFPVLAGRKLYYIDSEGKMDEIIIDITGRFLGFAPIKEDLSTKKPHDQTT